MSGERRGSHGGDAGGDLRVEEVDDGIEADERVQLQLLRRLLQHSEYPARRAHRRQRHHGRLCRPYAAAEKEVGSARVWFGYPEFASSWRRRREME